MLSSLKLRINFLDKNQCVFLYEDNAWTVKGHYDTALEDNDDATWEYDHESGQDFLRFLIVSKFLLVFFLKKKH